MNEVLVETVYARLDRQIREDLTDFRQTLQALAKVLGLREGRLSGRDQGLLSSVLGPELLSEAMLLELLGGHQPAITPNWARRVRQDMDVLYREAMKDDPSRKTLSRLARSLGRTFLNAMANQFAVG